MTAAAHERSERWPQNTVAEGQVFSGRADNVNPGAQGAQARLAGCHLTTIPDPSERSLWLVSMRFGTCPTIAFPRWEESIVCYGKTCTESIRTSSQIQTGSEGYVCSLPSLRQTGRVVYISSHGTIKTGTSWRLCSFESFSIYQVCLQGRSEIAELLGN